MGRSAGDVEARAVAVVGLACRFPGASSAEELWELLRDGVDATSETPSERYDVDALYSPNAEPGTVRGRRAGYIADVADFDAEFFGMSATEAAELDPQARLLLMTAWEALEDAGQRPDDLAGSRTGVFVGNTRADYLELQFRQGLESVKPSLFHNFRPLLPGRLSYAFDLRGPSVLLDTACSSSLSAVHTAVQSLRAGESPVALVAGVNLPLRPDEGVMLTQTGGLARDGRSKFGDATADGYAPSDGVGVVVLKPLTDALADGDRVRGVIQGSAVSNDGRTGDSVLTPSLQGQLDVLRWAYEDAGIAPGEVDFVEAHGTGTPSLDPLEFQALGEVLGEGRAPDHPCLVGSVKTNIGHAEAAGSIAGLIKTVLCLEHGQVPGVLHHDNPNPRVPWHELPLTVPAKMQDLPDRGRPLIAGVSGQGASCLNAHLVLRQGLTRAVDATLAVPAEQNDEACLLPLSARSPEALADLVSAYRAHLSPGGVGSVHALRDVCYSAATRRQHHEYRLAVVGSSHEDMAAALGGAVPRTGRDARGATLAAIAERYRNGWTPPWEEMYPGGGRFVPLPGYPWQTKRYWTGEEPGGAGTAAEAGLAERVLAQHARTAYADDSLLSEIGIDSLARLGIVLQLADEHGIEVDIEELADLRTVRGFRDWVGALEAKSV
jgi:acyl transferase domain-containing protein